MKPIHTEQANRDFYLFTVVLPHLNALFITVNSKGPVINLITRMFAKQCFYLKVYRTVLTFSFLTYKNHPCFRSFF